MAKIKDIYKSIDEIAPFRLQEGYDNSGLIIGNMEGEVKSVLTALDVTAEIAKEAAEKGADLIVTHHPVIFRALKRIDTRSLLGTLIAGDISVISAHTNFDSAVMNDILCRAIGLTPAGEPIAEENGAPIGCICEVDTGAEELAAGVKKALGCRVVRFNGEGKRLRRVAVCSGSGGSFLNEVIARGCDGFITGDVKHDVFIDAHNAGITVFDAGHFHTEDIFTGYMMDFLRESFPDVTVESAENDRDILSYEI